VSLLEEYVLILKDSFQLKSLVEGVRIGKGKHDHTRLYVDFVKSTIVFPIRLEIQVGKSMYNA